MLTIHLLTAASPQKIPCHTSSQHFAHTDLATAAAMDLLQLDATKSYEARYTSKRKDSVSPHSSESSSCDYTPLVTVTDMEFLKATLDTKTLKATKDLEILEADRTWSETLGSVKNLLGSMGGWIGESSKRLYRAQRRMRATNTRSTNPNRIDHEDLFLGSSSTPGLTEYLMLCIKTTTGSDRLIQVRLPSRVATDTEFFRILSYEYSEHRIHCFGIPNFWMYIEGIHFVRFQTQAPSVVLNEHTIRIVDSFSLPDVGDGRWTRRIESDRPPRPETMARYFKNPTAHGFSASRFNFLQVPRKVDSEIPARAGEFGWGLYYHERIRWLMIANIMHVITLIAIAIIFSHTFAY
jgi:hypothetical protein